MTIDRDRVLEALRSKRAHIEEQYGLRMVGIIGSVARGEATAQSDIDVWVDIIRTPSLFEDISTWPRGTLRWRMPPAAS